MAIRFPVFNLASTIETAHLWVEAVVFTGNRTGESIKLKLAALNER